jgi:hypothetical protein
MTARPDPRTEKPSQWHEVRLVCYLRSPQGTPVPDSYTVAERAIDPNDQTTFLARAVIRPIDPIELPSEVEQALLGVIDDDDDDPA